MTISSSLLQLTGRIFDKKVAESDNSSLSYVLNYFTTSLLTEQNITSRANLAIIESYLEKLREEINAKATDQKDKENKATRDKP